MNTNFTADLSSHGICTVSHNTCGLHVVASVFNRRSLTADKEGHPHWLLGRGAVNSGGSHCLKKKLRIFVFKTETAGIV